MLGLLKDSHELWSEFKKKQDENGMCDFIIAKNPETFTEIHGCSVFGMNYITVLFKNEVIYDIGTPDFIQFRGILDEIEEFITVDLKSIETIRELEKENEKMCERQDELDDVFSVFNEM